METTILESLVVKFISCGKNKETNVQKTITLKLYKQHIFT